jgi:hypothetical protein
MAIRSDATGGARTQIWSSATPGETTISASAAGSAMVRLRVHTESALVADFIAQLSDSVCYVRHTTTSGQYEAILDTAGGALSHSFSPAAADDWVTLVWTWDSSLGDGKRQKLYIDGVEVASSDFNASLDAAANARIIIGADTSDNTDHSYFEIAAWDGALSAAEVTSLQSDTADNVTTTATLDWHFLFDDTTGSVVATDADLDDRVGLGNANDLTIRAGSHIYTADDPLASPDPVIQLLLVSGGYVSISTTDSIELGSVPKDWSDASTPVVRLQLTNNGGGDALTGISVVASGDGTIEIAPATSLAQGVSADIGIGLDVATTGAKTTTVTVSSNELADFTVTLTWTVREDASRVVSEGAGFGTPPTESASLHGSGFERKIAAHVDVEGYFFVDGTTLEVCCVADHADVAWVKEIQVYFESDTVSKTIYTPTKSSRTGLIGHTFTLTASTAGDKEFYVRVVPVNGYERLIGPVLVSFNVSDGLDDGELFVASSGSDSTGDGSEGTPYATIKKAMSVAGTTGGKRVVMNEAGTYVEDFDNGLTLTNPTRVQRVVLGAGLSYGDVIVSLSTVSNWQSRCRKIQFEDIKFDIGLINRVTALVSDERFHFLRCGFVDIEHGAGGDPDGRTSTAAGAEWAGSFFRHDDGTMGVYETREWVGYSGPAGKALVVGGFGGENVTAYHGGDHYLDNTMVAGIDWVKADGVLAYIRYSDDVTLTASSAVYSGGSDETTLSIAGTPTLDESPDPGSTKIEVRTGALAGQTFDWVSTDNTAKGIVVEGDASSLDPADELWYRGVQHSDAFQLNQVSPFGNYILHKCDMTDVREVQAQLPQSPSSPGIGTGIGISLVAYGQPSEGAAIGLWEESYFNVVIRQCSYRNGNMQLSGVNAAMDDSVLIDCVLDQTILGSATTVACVLETGLGTGGNWTEASPEYDADTLVPTADGNLTGRLFFPRLPYDLYGNPVPRDGTGAVGAIALADGPTVTLTEEYNQIRITVPLYADELGADDLDEIWLQIERSDTGAFEGEEDLIIEKPTRLSETEATYLSTDASPSIPPIDDALNAGFVEHGVDLNPPANPHYRPRWVRYQAGVIVDSTPWGASDTIAYGGAPGVAFAGEYTPIEFKSRFGVVGGPGISQDTEQAFTHAGLLATQITLGPAGHVAQIESLLESFPDLTAYCDKPFGAWNFYIDDGVSAGTTGSIDTSFLRQVVGQHSTAGMWSIGAHRHINDIIFLGQELAETDLEEMGTTFVEEWSALHTLGVPAIHYGGPPLFQHDTRDEVSLESRLGPALQTGMYAAWDSSAPAQLVIAATLKADSVKVAADYMATTHADYAFFVEAGLSNTDNATILDAYPRAGTVQAFNLLFDDTSGYDGTFGSLAIDTGNIDPADYPDRVHIVLIASNTCSTVGAAATEAEWAEAVTKAVEDVKAFHPSLFPFVGSAARLDDAITNGDMTPAQIDRIKAATVLQGDTPRGGPLGGEWTDRRVQRVQRVWRTWRGQ